MKTRFSTYLLTLCASLCLLFSCTLEHTGDPKKDVRFVPYRVTVNSGQTKASLNGQTQYVFAEGDRLFVNHIVGNEVKMHGFMTLISGAGNTTAEFQGDLACEDEFTPESTTPISVTLISATDAIHNISNDKVGTIYPTNQFAGTFADAVAKFSDFTATSTFGATSLSLNQQSSFLIFNIRMKAVEEAPVARVITAKLYGDGNLEGIPLRSVGITVSEAGSVPFVLAFKGGDVSLANAILRLEWKNAENEDQSKEFTVSDQTLAANNYYTVSRTTIGFDGFRIRAKYDDTTLTFQFTDGSVEYSEDLGEHWYTYYGKTFELAANQQVYFRGNRANCDCNGDMQLFTANKVCYIAGDITSLLADPSTLPSNAFRSAFSRATFSTGTTTPGTVTWVDIYPGDPLILPASTSSYCYTEMFRNCTSLTSAPVLPATVLAERCYYRMFFSTSITSVPTMPAIVTFDGDQVCYQMFQNCIYITTLSQPLFGGTMTLRKGCFQDMFAHCTGLTSVDRGLLPATNLAQDCYRGMFQDTRFERAPDLLATTLVSECYRYMFNACTNLKYIKCLATTNLGDGYTTNWVSNDGNKKVPNTSDCEFVGADATLLPTISWPRNAHGILSNWKATPVSQVQAP